MNLDEKKKTNVEWYDNPNVIIWLIILIISIIILSSQSFSINSQVGAFKMFKDVLNHNITYMFALVYFISLETKIGKKFFDYSNLAVIIFSFILLVTSVLTIFQTFNFTTLLSLCSRFLFFIYFFHTFLKDTKIWNDFDLQKSIFNEFSNEWYFYAIVVVEVLLFAISLVFTATFSGTVLATFRCIYIILFARYIYLYGEFLKSKNVVKEEAEIKEEKEVKPEVEVKEEKEVKPEVKEKKEKKVKAKEEVDKDKGDK